MRAERRRKERRRNILFGASLAGLAVLVIGGIGLYVSKRGGGWGVSGVQSLSGLGPKHVQGTVHYGQTPPVGGPHNPTPLNCGIYTAPVPNVNAVHSLEHGAVWVTYRPTLPAASISALQNLVRSEPQKERRYTI